MKSHQLSFLRKRGQKVRGLCLLPALDDLVQLPDVEGN